MCDRGTASSYKIMEGRGGETLATEDVGTAIFQISDHHVQPIGLDLSNSSMQLRVG